MTYRIDNPAKTIERCSVRLVDDYRKLAAYEKAGLEPMVKMQKRVIAGRKATITRMIKCL